MTFVQTQARAWKQIREMFSGNETPNGPGSQLDNAQQVMDWLPEMLREYDILSMLDAPCGDLNWMRHLDLGGTAYTGWDVEKEFIEANRKLIPQYNFQRVNLLTKKEIPYFDLIMVRDFMIHLPNGYIAVLLDKIKASGARYLIATNHPGDHNEHACPLDGGHDDRPGYFHRPVNLEAEPFNLVDRRLDSIAESEHHELVLFDMAR